MNDALEIGGDAREDVEAWELEQEFQDQCEREYQEERDLIHGEDAVCESWYLDWCYRMGMAPGMEYRGQGTAPDGEPVNVWRFA